MKLEITLHNVENLSGNLEKYSEIITALITSGGLDGVKAGQTIIHFDSEGVFMGVQLSYWPYKRRKRMI